MSGRPRTLRGRLLLIVSAAVVGVIVVAVVGLNIALRTSLLDDARTAARERAEAAALAVAERAADRDVPVVEAASGVDAWTRVGDVVHEPPGASPATAAAARQLLVSADTSAEVTDESAMLGAATIESAGVEAGRAVAYLSLSPYERTERHILVASVAAGGLLALLVIGITAWALRSALRPIDEMTTTAASWSETGSTRRFERGEPVDEVSGLAATLDHMLDRVQASLAHERQLTAEVSHELRTPLARIVAEADLALADGATPDERRAALAAIRDDALHMDEVITALLDAARRQAEGKAATCDAVEVVRNALTAVQAPGSAIAASLDASGPAVAALDAALLGRVVSPVLENACRHARTRVEARVERAGARVRITIVDDGPGVRAGEVDDIFEPGHRGSAAGGDGAGLGLALARRMARAAGGDVVAVPGPEGRFEVTAPGA